MSPPPRVVLTGSTGGLGSAVLKHIIAQNIIPLSKLIISLYNPTKAPSAAAGLEIRKGDYTSSHTLDNAFNNAKILFLVSYPSIAHKLRVDAHKNAIDAAKRAGITHIIYTSLAFGGDLSDTSVAAVMQAHIDTEAYLKSSGVTYTILREGIYSESYPLYLGFFDPSSEQQEICIPDDGNGGIAWASRDELGEATAKLIARAYNNDLSTSPPLENATYLLSGPTALSLSSLASILSNILSRSVRVKYVSVDAYTTSSVVLARLGPEFARLWATTYDALKQGECASVTPTLELLLGRRPQEMSEVLSGLLRDVGGNTAKDAIDQYAK